MKKTISIGIPAYNEEANIGHLINSLLNQKGDNFTLKEIIIISDASTDKTAEIIRGMSDKRIIFIENRERIGQALSQNIILEHFTGDILLLINADVLPADEYYIQEMTKLFYRDSRIGIVSSRDTPLKPQVFFEKIIHYGFTLKTQIFEQKDHAQNMYLCHGSNRAFSREFVKQMKWPHAVGEDVYSYFQCLEKGYIFSYITTTGILSKLPDNFKDHLRQSARYVVSEKIMSNYFSLNLVKKEYDIPLIHSLKTVVPLIVRHPVLFFCYSLIFLVTRIYPRKNRFGNSKWEISKSSKTLFRKETSDINMDMKTERTTVHIPTVTIGIPTRYGGVLIIPTIESIQASTGVVINRILVIADKTPISPQEKKHLNELGVELIWNNGEGSWAKKIKQMLGMCTTDIFITTQDDVIFEPQTIAEIVKTFQEEESVTMVSSAILPLPPRTFFESILGAAVRIPHRIASLWNRGDNYLSASGRCLSFRTEFMRKLEIPEHIINSDAFLYFKNKELGGVMRHAPQSIVYIDQPKTLREQLGPSSRYQISKTELSPYFKHDISSEYHIPFCIGTQAVLLEFTRRPIRTTLYLFIFTYTRFYRNTKDKALDPFWGRGISKQLFKRHEK